MLNLTFIITNHKRNSDTIKISVYLRFDSSTICQDNIWSGSWKLSSETPPLSSKNLRTSCNTSQLKSGGLAHRAGCHPPLGGEESQLSVSTQGQLEGRSRRTVWLVKLSVHGTQSSFTHRLMWKNSLEDRRDLSSWLMLIGDPSHV